MNYPEMTLAQKVAQLFILGSDTPDLADALEPFARTGLGGVLLFRHHLQGDATAYDVREKFKALRGSFAQERLTWISIDQEGGTVERLPHWLFPTGIMPIVLGQQETPDLCRQINQEVARRMRWLGINLNFTPTVDLNTEMMNPIIGIRAYSSTPEGVLPFARAVVKAHQEAGVLPVAKHFPGHGSGIVDSHEALPRFDAWQPQELKPYEALIADGLPGVLVAHGLYPQLSRQVDSPESVPASLSPGIITSLLRQKLGFKGLVFTDDLMMGAVWGDKDPVEVALDALKAGADLLVYRRPTPEALAAYEAILHRVQSGKLAEALIDDKVQRSLAMAAQLKAAPVYDYPAEAWGQEACHETARQWAQQAMHEYHHTFVSPLPLSHTTRWALVYPDRQTMRHYAPDAAHGKDLLGWCREYGLNPVADLAYPVEGSSTDAPLPDWQGLSPEVIVFVAFNSQLWPFQQTLYKHFKTQYSEAKMILASAGLPADREVLARPWVHVQLPSLRPAAMQAFVQWLTAPPKAPGAASLASSTSPEG